MKKILLILYIAINFTSMLIAQTCADHPYFKEGNRIKYVYLDENNLETGGNTLIISNVNISSNSYTSSVSYSMFDKTSMAEGSITCSCKNGKVMYPAYGYFNKNYEVVNGKDTLIFTMQFLNGTPSQELIQPQIGSKLADYEFNYKLIFRGVEMSYQIKYSNLKVVGFETITVDQSQFSAWKIIGTTQNIIKDLGVNEYGSVEYYYSLEKGIIKQVNYNAEGKLSSSVLLK